MEREDKDGRGESRREVRAARHSRQMLRRSDRSQGAWRDDRLERFELPAGDMHHARHSRRVPGKPGGADHGQARCAAVARARRGRPGLFQRPVRLCAHQPGVRRCGGVPQRRARHAAPRLRAVLQQHLQLHDEMVREPGAASGHSGCHDRCAVQQRLRRRREPDRLRRCPVPRRHRSDLRDDGARHGTKPSSRRCAAARASAAGSGWKPPRTRTTSPRP